MVFSGLLFIYLFLPIGISFYTFQTISYTVDVYRGKVQAQRKLSTFLLYVSLFPQLVAGPIVRYIEENVKATPGNPWSFFLRQVRKSERLFSIKHTFPIG